MPPSWVVMDSDRFGISQLHQLRGRIGRGQHPSLCLLATRLPETSKAGERIKAVAATLDGFALADLDLRRSVVEGDVLGLNQSGRTINLRFLSLRRSSGGDHRCPGVLRVVVRAGGRDDPGMALLAAQFVETDRVEYLDKA